MFEREYNILPERKSEFYAELKKITKKYELNCEVDERPILREKKTVKTVGYDMEIEVAYHPIIVKLSSESFIIEGYDYLGCIKSDSEVDLFTVHGNNFAEDKGISLSKIAETISELSCDHCKRNHTRKIGHVFVEKDTDELKVFGSGCAKKYFGINFLSMLHKFEKVFEAMGDKGYGFGGYGFLDPEVYVPLCYKEITEHGFLSRSKCDDMEIPTSMIVLDNMGDFYRMKAEVRNEHIKDVPKDTIKKFMEYEFVDMDKENLNDFEHNLKNVVIKLDRGNVSVKDAGFLAYMVYRVFFYVDPKEVEKQQKNDDISEFEGREKERIRNLKLTVINHNSWETIYGTTHLYTMVNEIGQTFKWFASKSMFLERIVEINDTVILDGTIKEIEHHETYGNNVIITRCKLKVIE